MIARIMRSAALALLAAPFVTSCGRQADTTAPVATESATAASAAGQQSALGPGVRPSPPLDEGNVLKLVDDYKAACGKQAKAPEQCRVLHSVLVAELSVALGVVERSADQRGAARALAALDIPTEPQIVVPALRILGKFPTTPGLAAKVLPQLGNRYIEIQRMSATVLAAIPDAGAVDVGQLWLRNHGDLTTETVYDEYPDFPAHYASIGFPKYPDATWFSPADSDRSIGWSTRDDATTVIKWFGEALKTQPIDMTQWVGQQQAQVRQRAVGAFDPAKMARMQQLMEQAIKGDAKAVAEMEKMQEDMNKQSTAAGDALEKALYNLTPPDSAAARARYIVAKTNGGNVTAAVLVFPLPGVQRTVIQTAWDLGAYPSAWPTATN